ncbi:MULTISPECIES: GntR family transcriptional regulator [Prauserella salsuginis group]|uniref:GntR family transcriptional regulator n=1 Tax=Prauserella salsuginis TaxID=387889 RepID=A0ABW6G0M1_9PSEU|nr:regulatory protein, gntR family [Prauserella flava]MCR3735917.1 regulatory protein, gntR family [Prauserella salsuginis]
MLLCPSRIPVSTTQAMARSTCTRVKDAWSNRIVGFHRRPHGVPARPRRASTLRGSPNPTNARRPRSPPACPSMPSLDRVERAKDYPEAPYEQIAAKIRRSVLDGRLRPGDPAPTQKQIQREHHVSAGTANRSCDSGTSSKPAAGAARSSSLRRSLSLSTRPPTRRNAHGLGTAVRAAADPSRQAKSGRSWQRQTPTIQANYIVFSVTRRAVLTDTPTSPSTNSKFAYQATTSRYSLSQLCRTPTRRRRSRRVSTGR